MKKNCYSNLKYLVIWLLLCAPTLLIAQPVKTYDAAEIKLALKKLNVLGTVLYIGAHPDDENTAFLSYCSSGELLRTGYLSLTRGDGGQNLIGTEQAELLGVIRTQELLQARKLDGANQFFTRAVDFGYTKSPEETFKKWNKNELLSDVVWVIRKFKPDVIVTRFPVTGEGRHGQHTASAILALDGFQMAGDPNLFPEQLEFVDVWAPERIYWNGWTPALKQMGVDSDTLIKINLGSYNSLLGKSYTEISAESRSMHKSQGFGDSGWRANHLNYFIYMYGNPAKDNLFSGIDITWNRINNSDDISNLLAQAYEDFNDDNPSESIPLLLEAYNKVMDIPDVYWTQVKAREILNLIRACAGIWIEAVTDSRIFTPGSKIIVKTGIVNRSELPFKLQGVHISHQIQDTVLNSILLEGNFTSIEKEIHLPENIDFTQPYWLVEKRDGDMYHISDQTMIGLAEGRPPLMAHFRISINGTIVVFSTPVLYRKNDPTRGEIYSPIVIAPPVTVNFESNLFLFASDEKRELTITLKNFNDKINGELKLTAPGNWKILPQSIAFEMTKKNEEKRFVFTIAPPLEDSRAEIKASITINNTTSTKSSITIKYDHIPEETVFSSAKAKIVRLNIGEKVINRIGYIMGSGDKIPDYLRELSFKVDILEDDFLSNNNLSKYDVIIAGIRAYNTVERMEAYQDKILKYVRNGGTYVVQYNTLGKRFADPGPYKLNISRDRVAEEDAYVTVIDPHSQLLQFPNTITENDFNDWVQERGLYFPDEWDDEYIPVLEMNDADESPKRGSILFAKYGDGIFIYTGLSFFREFPAGVPGAYRLFINLISAGKFAN